MFIQRLWTSRDLESIFYKDKANHRRVLMKTKIWLTAVIAVVSALMLVACQARRSGSSETRTVSSETLTPFSGIRVEMTVASVELRAGSEYGISIYANSADGISYSVANNILTVTQSAHAQISFNDNNTRPPSVTITLPSTALAKSSTGQIKTSAGGISVHDVDLGRITVTTDIGSIEIDNATLASPEIKTSDGLIKLTNISFVRPITITSTVGLITGTDIDFNQSATISTTDGMVRLSSSKFNADSTITVKVGSVEVTDPSEAYFTGKSNIGRVSIASKFSNRYAEIEVAITTSDGNITVN
jgi:ribosomal protein L31